MDEPVNAADDPRRKTGFGGRSGDDAREARHRLDDEIRRLDQQLSSDEQDAPVDHVTRSVELRDRLYRQGSYAELEHALEQLRQEDQLAYELAMFVAYQPFGEEPIDPVRRSVIRVCELLAVRIDGPVRVPPFVPVSPDAELERTAREGKGALWRGRGNRHSLQRGERNALIVAMAEAGRSPGEIALRFNLTRKRVQQILAQHADEPATGPAA